MSKTPLPFLPPPRWMRQQRPKSFRVFWGAVLDSCPAVKNSGLDAQFTMSKREFRDALNEAFQAGRGLSAADAALKKFK
jgi:hypothetical protein